ncbi:IS3 family transposase, partial [Clostridium sp.]|uniref:IS3 family transposase n=1 Tax=Clostridium sp. TaxID=1506 RepID=UPI00261EEDC2
MSRKATCHDNAVVENFFSILKTELLYIREFTSMEEIKMELIDYIKYYNNDRIKQNLNWLSPVKYRKSVA